MQIVMGRALNYLEEAVRLSAELQKGKTDTRRHDQFVKTANIPTGTWFPLDSIFTEQDSHGVQSILLDWDNGTLKDFGNAYAQIEEDMDLDPTYILFGVPIFNLSPESQRRLRELGERYGTRALGTSSQYETYD